MKLPHKKRPCRNCPFKKNTLKGWLGRERMAGIVNGDGFPCHKHKAPRQQCAGHMLLLGSGNAFVALAENMGIQLELTGRESVFKSTVDCIEHHAAG